LKQSGYDIDGFQSNHYNWASTNWHREKEVIRLARRRKRKSRRRQEGRRILEQVPQYSIESGEDKPVTAARRYIHTEGIAPPALLLVKRNEHTTDRYFWAEKGLFGAQYVEENHFLFPSLRILENPEPALVGTT
jgi:Protein of unknown function (DUF3155)